MRIIVTKTETNESKTSNGKINLRFDSVRNDCDLDYLTHFNSPITELYFILISSTVFFSFFFGKEPTPLQTTCPFVCSYSLNSNEKDYFLFESKNCP